jgi:hypothetical protein
MAKPIAAYTGRHRTGNGRRDRLQNVQDRASVVLLTHWNGKQRQVCEYHVLLLHVTCGCAGRVRRVEPLFDARSCRRVVQCDRGVTGDCASQSVSVSVPTDM